VIGFREYLDGRERDVLDYPGRVTGRSFVGGWEDATLKSVSVMCGWCSREVEMNLIGPSVEIARVEMYPRPMEVRIGAPYVCPRSECHRPSLVFLNFFEKDGDTYGISIAGQMPRGRAKAMEGLPEAIADVRDEAWSSFYGGDRRAAVVMGRAAVQRATRTLGGEGRDLFHEIDSLREQGKVTEELKEWAHEVRLGAREAAHPEELGEVSQEEAKQSLDWMDAFLEFAIALPERRRQAKVDES